MVATRMVIRTAAVAALLATACGGSTSPIGDGRLDLGGGSSSSSSGSSSSGGGSSSGATGPGSCSPGDAPLVLASNLAAVAIAVDASDVFVGLQGHRDGSKGGVARIPKTGGSFTKLAESVEVWGLDVDDSFVFWADRSGGSIARVPKAGGATTPLTGARETAYGVAAHGGDVFWAEGSGVGQVAKDGGPSSMIDGVSSSTHVAADADHIYWTEWSGNVSKRARAGGPTTVLAHVQYAYTIAIDADSVYFVANGTVRRVAKTGGPVVTLLERGQGASMTPDGIAVDDSAVYFADLMGKGIHKIAKSGGAVSLVASGESFPRAVAVDASCVYWTTDGILTAPHGTVMRAPK